MRVCCVRSLDELASYADDWDRLAAGSPFRSWTWLSNWWRHYGPTNDAEAQRLRLATLCVYDGNSLTGIAPWFTDCSALRGKVLRQLGSGEVCSDYLGILCDPAGSEAVIESLANYLIANAFSDDPDAVQWSQLFLDGIYAEDRIMAAFVERLTALGCSVHRRSGLSCWHMDLPTDWETFVASLGRSLRRDVRRLERNLLDTDRVVVHRVQRIEELPEAMDILVDLHQRRRMSLGEAGCFASPRFLAFYRDVVPELFRRGRLEFFWLELDGRAVAAEYQIASEGILYEYQAGIDPDAMEHQPGKLINAAIMRQAIASGYRAFDFLRGDERYKARFGGQARPTVEYRIAPQRPVARLRHNLWIVGSSVKRWMKRGIEQ